MRKPTFCICENKDADQLRGKRADQRLCFRYIDSTIPLLSKSEISSLDPSTVAVQPGCGPGQKPECWFSHNAAQSVSCGNSLEVPHRRAIIIKYQQVIFSGYGHHFVGFLPVLYYQTCWFLMCHV